MSGIKLAVLKARALSDGGNDDKINRLREQIDSQADGWIERVAPEAFKDGVVLDNLRNEYRKGALRRLVEEMGFSMQEAGGGDGFQHGGIMIQDVYDEDVLEMLADRGADFDDPVEAYEDDVRELLKRAIVHKED